MAGTFDPNLFYVLSLAVFGIAFLGMMIRNDNAKLLGPFMAMLLAMFTMLEVNSDGGLTTAPVWPTLYLPLFGFVLNVGVLLKNGLSK